MFSDVLRQNERQGDLQKERRSRLDWDTVNETVTGEGKIAYH